MKHVIISGESYTLNRGLTGVWFYERDDGAFGYYCHSRTAHETFEKLNIIRRNHPHLNIHVIARKKKRFIRLTEYVGRFFGRFKK